METLDIEGSVMKIELKSEKFIQNNSEQFAQDKALSLNLENLRVLYTLHADYREYMKMKACKKKLYCCLIAKLGI